MSLIKNLAVKEKVIEVEYPDIEGFKVKVGYVHRDKLVKLRDKATKIKTDRRTGRKEEEVDNDLFLEGYAEAVIKGWSGLNAKGLSELMLIDLSSVDPATEIPYSPEDAVDLLKNSPQFDRFITEVSGDFKNFEAERMATQTKN